MGAAAVTDGCAVKNAAGGGAAAGWLGPRADIGPARQQVT